MGGLVGRLIVRAKLLILGAKSADGRKRTFSGKGLLLQVLSSHSRFTTLGALDNWAHALSEPAQYVTLRPPAVRPDALVHFPLAIAAQSRSVRRGANRRAPSCP